jgi:hypothetical protein
MAFTGNASTISSHAALRLLSHTVDQTAFVMSANTAPDGGGGTYVYVATDTSSGCMFTGSASGTTLSVTSVTNGALTTGFSVNRSDTGASIGTIIPGGSGTGGTGTYTLSASASITGPFSFTADNDSSFIVAVDGGRWFNVGYVQQTPAEIATGLTPINYSYPPGNMLRYGIVPNDAAKATANGTILQTLLAASIPNGPTGQFYFPNTTGADVYSFDLRFYPIRDGVHIDLQNCTLIFSGGAPTAGKPILMWIRDFRLENGNLSMTGYTGTSGLLHGGSRYNDGIGWPANPAAPFGIQDQDDLLANGKPLQGNYILRNLRISSSNSGQTTLVLIGGLRNVTLDNLWFDGTGVVVQAIYYEWGVASTTINGGVPANSWTWTTSHAANMIWRNIRATNHATGTNNAAIGANGAHNLICENIDINGCSNGLSFGSGEAFYYRPWAQDGLTGSPRSITMRDILVQNVSQYGINAIGAQTCGAGSLMYNAINALGAVAKSQAQTDYLNFVIDGAKIYGDGGVSVSGRTVDLRNIQVIGAGIASSGGVFVGQDTLHLSIQNCDIRGVHGNGIRNNVIPGSPLWSPYRPKFMSVRDCIIAGCTTIGIVVDQMQSAVIENNQLGYNTVEGDTANESVMTAGVNVGLNQTANAVVCRSNFTTVAAGGSAYANIGPFQVAENERNTLTTSGNWITQLPAATVNGFGTPTGATITANFPGATATLLQTSGAVAELIAVLKQNRILGT